MSGLRTLLAVVALFALFLTSVALWNASLGSIVLTRYRAIPIVIVTFFVWGQALLITTRVAKARGISLPGIAQFYGMWVASRAAPIWALAIACVGLTVAVALGQTGEVQGLPVNSHEAQIWGSALSVFLALSVPVLWSRDAQAGPNGA